MEATLRVEVVRAALDFIAVLASQDEDSLFDHRFHLAVGSALRVVDGWDLATF